MNKLGLEEHTVYRILYPIQRMYSLLDINKNLPSKESLNVFQRMSVIQTLWYDYKAIKGNYKNINYKTLTNFLTSTFLNNL